MRNPNRVNVYLDGEFAFGLARVVAAWLNVGQELTDEKIASLQSEDTLEVAYQAALRLLGIRPRTRWEIQQRLERQGFDRSIIVGVIKRLEQSSLVNDSEFARLWVENRTTFRPRSHRMMAVELKRMGVEDDYIQGALKEGKQDSELAYQAAVKYAGRLTGLDWITFRTKLTGHLARRGFGYETVQSVVRQVWQGFHFNNESHPENEKDEDE